MVKYWIKSISGNIKAVFFKLGTRNVVFQVIVAMETVIIRLAGVNGPWLWQKWGISVLI